MAVGGWRRGNPEASSYSAPHPPGGDADMLVLPQGSRGRQALSSLPFVLLSPQTTPGFLLLERQLSPLAIPQVRSSPTPNCRRPRAHLSGGSSGRRRSPSSQPTSGRWVTGTHSGKQAMGFQVLHARWSSAFRTPTSIFDRRGPGRERITSYLEASKLS